MGPDRIQDAFACTKPFAAICLTGILTKVWALEKWSPAESIETGKKLTSFQCARDIGSNALGEALQRIAKNVEAGKIDARGGIGLTLKGLESIIKGHEEMEANRVSGKVVVVLD